MIYEYLIINGHNMPVKVSGGAQEDDSTGFEGRSITGQLRREQIYHKRKWNFSTPWMELWEAYAYQQWIEGRGHYYAFDGDTYSSKGKGGWTGPVSSVSVESPKFGNKYANVASATTNDFGPNYGEAWTVAFWALVGGIWQHRMETADGRQWQDFVPASYAWSLDMSDVGVLTLATGDYDDLVVFPFLIPDALGDEWPQTSAYGSVPTLTISGQAIQPSAFAEGVQTSVSHEQAMIDGIMAPLGSLSFSLREV